MVQLNPITDLSVEPVTRQSLFDVWGNAALGTLSESDLAPESKPIVAQDSPPTEAPGRLWWNTLEHLMYVYTDELDGTGVSLWLAVGPDRFDTACLAAEPIPPGAIVEAWYDRKVKVINISDAKVLGASDGVLADGIPRPIGCNQSGIKFPLNTATSVTTASDAWCAVGIDGLVYAQTAPNSGVSANWYVPANLEWLWADPRNPGSFIKSKNFLPVDFPYTIGMSISAQAAGMHAASQPGQRTFMRVYWTGLRRTSTSDLGS